MHKQTIQNKAIRLCEWDSHVFKKKIGCIPKYSTLPKKKDLSQYQHVSVRVPADNHEIIVQYQKLGFCFITTDYTLKKNRAAKSAINDCSGSTLLLLRKKKPDIKIHGFKIDGSRLTLDKQLRNNLPVDFWDTMIREHAASYADYVIFAVKNNEAQGFISYFEDSEKIQLFLVAVHPKHQGRGIGTLLLAKAESIAGKKHLLTNVVSQNLKGINFYINNGFRFHSAETILHFHNTCPSENDSFM